MRSVKITALILALLLFTTNCRAESVDVYSLAISGTPQQLKEAVKNGVNFNLSSDDESHEYEVYDISSVRAGNAWFIYHNESPLHIAAALNRNPESIKFLISLGLDVNAEAEDGSFTRTPLSCAVDYKNFGAIHELLEAGANPEGWTLGGWYVATPFHDVAAWYGYNTEEVRYVLGELIKAGGNVNVHDENVNAEAVLEELETLRDDLNPDNSDALDGDTFHYMIRNNTLFSRTGWLHFAASCTPLIYAVFYDNPLTVEVLLDLGADAKIRSVEGKTAMDYARELPENSNLKKSPVYARLMKAAEN
ncbi:MAG: ankyrin repeat domain-containing protein [Synergistaceae bacterium]|nr:ankyrin repeat domain-containing protein [Synergistaceae bacterium]